MMLARLATIGLIPVIVSAAFSAVAAGNLVTQSSASASVRSIGPDDLKPPECAHIAIGAMVAGNGTLNAANANTLLIGGPGADTLNGGNGSDCLVGGAGNNRLNGGQGNDVLIGGPGDERLFGGPGNDTCYGRGGTDQYINCQTIIAD
ncbi:MAG TPA: hypothetical protein VMM78_17735 [Thermomicrobiales bacterium]|nr:hypothetical protein [Thermomicrobiales bacterium]